MFRGLRLSLDERLELVLSVGESCEAKEDLRSLLQKKSHIRAYDGFEPSGRMTIAQVQMLHVLKEILSTSLKSAVIAISKVPFKSTEAVY